MVNIGELATIITAKTEPFTRGLRKAGAEAAVFSKTLSSKLGATLSSMTSKMASFTTRIAKLGSAMVVGAGVAGIGWGAKLAMDAEKAQLSLGVFLKSQDKAAVLMKDIAKFSEDTPFNSATIVEATQKLLSYGYTLEELRDMWTQMGNVSALTGADMTTLAEILGRVRSQNRADLMDVSRVADRAGFFLEMLAKRQGVAVSGLRELASQGKLSAKAFADAFADMSAPGGPLAGGMALLSTTISAKWDTLVEKMGNSFKAIAIGLFDKVDLKGLQDKMAAVLETYKQTIIEAATTAANILIGGAEIAGEAYQATSQGKNLWKAGWYKAKEIADYIGVGLVGATEGPVIDFLNSQGNDFKMSGLQAEMMRRAKENRMAYSEAITDAYKLDKSNLDRAAMRESIKASQAAAQRDAARNELLMKKPKPEEKAAEKLDDAAESLLDLGQLFFEAYKANEQDKVVVGVL